MTFSQADIPYDAPELLAKVKTTHQAQHITPNEDPSLAYRMIVPKDWIRASALGETPSGMGVARGIGIFAEAPHESAGVVGLTVTTMPIEIPIDTWTKLQLESEGWTIVHQRWLPEAEGKTLLFDIVGVRTVQEGGQEHPEVQRSFVRLDNGRIFSLNCFARREAWERCKEHFWLAGVTFELFAGDWHPRAESRKQVQGPDLGLGFSYPQSWSASYPDLPSPKKTFAVDLRLIGGDGATLLAYLRAKATKQRSNQPRTLEQRKQTAYQDLVSSGFQPAGEPKELPPEDEGRRLLIEGWQGSYQLSGVLGHSTVEARFGFSTVGDLDFTHCLLCPLRSDDLFTNLRGIRAFEIVRESIQHRP